MFPQTTTCCVAYLNCHIGTTICLWLLGLPGTVKLNDVYIYILIYNYIYDGRNQFDTNPKQLRPQDLCLQFLHFQGMVHTWRAQPNPYLACLSLFTTSPPPAWNMAS